MIKLVARPGNSKAPLIKKIFDQQGRFYVLPAIKSLIGTAFYRLEAFEFCFPIAQHMGFEIKKIRHLTYFKKQFVRYVSHSVSLKTQEASLIAALST